MARGERQRVDRLAATLAGVTKRDWLAENRTRVAHREVARRHINIHLGRRYDGRLPCRGDANPFGNPEAKKGTKKKGGCSIGCTIINNPARLGEGTALLGLQ